MDGLGCHISQKHRYAGQNTHRTIQRPLLEARDVANPAAFLEIHRVASSCSSRGDAAEISLCGSFSGPKSSMRLSWPSRIPENILRVVRLVVGQGDACTPIF